MKILSPETAPNHALPSLDKATLSEPKRSIDRFANWTFRSAQIFLVIWSAFYLIRGTVAALLFDGPPADGPFQIFNPLRRIAAGQTPGVDFQFYHGIGVPYLHYPLFAAFGKTINASELARQLTSYLLFAAVLGLFAWLASRSVRWAVLAAAVTIIALELAFRMEAAGPGNSQIGVRSTLPVLAFAALLARFDPNKKAVLFGCGIGASLVCGFEQGLAMMLAIVVVYIASLVLAAFRGSKWREIALPNTRFVLLAIISGVITTALLMTALGGPKGMIGALHYNLVELPADQFWYDGIPPNPYLGVWSDLISSRSFFLPLVPMSVGIVLLIGIVLRTNGHLRIGRDWQMFAAIMLVYGIASNVSLLGMYSKHYTFPVCRILLLVGIVILSSRLTSRTDLRRLATQRSSAFAFVCGVLMIAFIGGALGLGFSTVRTARRFASSDAGRHQYLGARWSNYMHSLTRTIDGRSAASPVSLWSTYAGLPESHYGVFHPTDDYLSLAVAERRNNYFAEFRKRQPQFVQTIWPGYFPYEEWLQNVNWPFYEDIINNYAMLGRIDFAVLWQRKRAPWVTPAQDFEDLPIDQACNCVHLPGDSTGVRLKVVKLSYSIHNPWERLPVIGLTPRYLVTPEGTPRHNPIGLPQYKTEIEFPVDVPPSGATLRFQTRSLLPGASFVVSRVQARQLEAQPELLPVMSPDQVRWEDHTLSAAMPRDSVLQLARAH